MSGAIRFDDVREGEIVLSGEEQERFLKQASAMAQQLADTSVKAKYKLEIMFAKSRSSQRPTPGMLSFWASGAKLHGGGDDKLYLCPGRTLKVSGCTAVLQANYNNSRGIICPACGSLWKHEDVIGELMFNLPMRKWAEVLYQYYRLFEYNADIYLKYAKDDIRTVSLAQKDKATWKGSQQLDAVREKRARQVYPLRNIIADTSAGADLLTRFYAFLVA